MRKSLFVLAIGILTVGADCGDEAGPEEEEICVGFCGTWSGGESSGQQKTGTIKFTVNGTTLTGDVSPISGSVRELVGTVSATGAITASLAASGTNACAVNLSGQITDGPSGSATATGTYTLVASNTCNANNGTWTATRPIGLD